MSQIDKENTGLEDQQQEKTDDEKMVPVSESIRYRKRAQRAEQQAQQLSKDYTRLERELNEVKSSFNDAKLDCRLFDKLNSAKAVDIETAALVAKKRLSDSEEKDVESVVEELAKEKPYLFNSKNQTDKGINLTSPAKQKVPDNNGMLESAAKRASDSGDRIDLQEYLRLRRTLL
jgi:hypothetical protein